MKITVYVHQALLLSRPHSNGRATGQGSHTGASSRSHHALYTWRLLYGLPNEGATFACQLLGSFAIRWAYSHLGGALNSFARPGRLLKVDHHERRSGHNLFNASPSYYISENLDRIQTLPTRLT